MEELSAHVRDLNRHLRTDWSEFARRGLRVRFSSSPQGLTCGFSAFDGCQVPNFARKYCLSSSVLSPSWHSALTAVPLDAQTDAQQRTHAHAAPTSSDALNGLNREVGRRSSAQDQHRRSVHLAPRFRGMANCIGSGPSQGQSAGAGRAWAGRDRPKRSRFEVPPGSPGAVDEIGIRNVCVDTQLSMRHNCVHDYC